MKQAHFKRLLAPVLMALASASALADGPNIVANGGFESPGVSASTGFNTFSTISGWTVDSQIEIRNNRVGSAFEGSNFAELDAENNKNNTISQTLVTEIGATYTFSFEFSNRPFKSVTDPVAVPASSSGLSFIIGSLSGAAPAQATITDDKQHWELFTTTFTATSTSTLLSFTATGTADNFGSSLDDVQVTLLSAPVPEPSSYALMAAGLGVVGFIARRRRRI